MLRTRRTGMVILTFAALAATAACGDVAGATDDAGAGTVGPQLTVTLKVAGATTVEGKQTASTPSENGRILSSCAEYAKGSTDKKGRTFFVSGGLLNGPVDGKKVTFEFWVEDYAGPGTYPKDQLAAPGNDPSVAVDDTVYSIHESSSSQVVTDGKGGGRWTFKKLLSNESKGAVSGEISWTCKS